MEIAFAGNFVAAIGDLAHDMGHLIGDPAQTKECSLVAEFVEHIQADAGVMFDTRVKTRPVPLRNNTTVRSNVEIVFQIDCQKMLSQINHSLHLFPTPAINA